MLLPAFECTAVSAPPFYDLVSYKQPSAGAEFGLFLTGFVVAVVAALGVNYLVTKRYAQIEL